MRWIWYIPENTHPGPCLKSQVITDHTLVAFSQLDPTNRKLSLQDATESAVCKMRASYAGAKDSEAPATDPSSTVYPKKYAHGFVVLCFVVVMKSFIMNSHEAFIHIHQGCFAGTGAIVRLPQCQWSKPDGYGKISQCITTTKHSKAKTVCIFLGIYCSWWHYQVVNCFMW